MIRDQFSIADGHVSRFKKSGVGSSSGATGASNANLASNSGSSRGRGRGRGRVQGRGRGRGTDSTGLSNSTDIEGGIKGGV